MHIVNIVTPAVKATSREITSCVDCPHHRIERDPDPHDSFCSDDVKVRCDLSRVVSSGYYEKEPYVTVACRPYNTRKETPIPDWCPLLTNV
jgi:hypothetical protein